MERLRTAIGASHPFRFRKTPIALALAAGVAPGLCSALPGDKLGVEFRANTYVVGGQTEAAVATSASGDLIVAWNSYAQDGSMGGVYAQRYDGQGRPLGAEFRVNSTVTGSQGGPRVAMDQDGDFVVVWGGGQPGDVYVQRYDRNGVAQGGEVRVNALTTGPQWATDVAMNQHGDFIVTWSSGYTTSGVHARRFNRLGTPLGDEFQVDVPGVNGTYGHRVAMDVDGDFVVVWTSETIDGAFSGVAARRYDRYGNALGAEFRVNATTANWQNAYDVDMDDAGNFVVVWDSYGGPGDNAVYFQRYDAAGVLQGGETSAPAASTGLHLYPSVAIDADGDFVVAWVGAIAEPLTIDIWARRFDRLGAAQGAEFRVNTYTTDHQFNPAAAMDANGGFVVAWHSFGQDSSEDGIYAQRYRGYETFARPVPDLNGNFTPEVASIYWSGTAWLGRVRDSFSGELLGSVTFGAGFDVADATFYGDAASPQLAVASMRRTGTDGRVELRPLAGGFTLVGGLKRPLRLQTIADVNANGTTDLAVLDLDPATDAVRALVREGSTLTSIRIMNFSSEHLPIDMAVLPDLSGNAKGELAVLGQNYLTGGVRVESRDAFTGVLFNTTDFNPDVFPYALAVAPDINGGGKPELVVAGVDDVFQEAVVQLLDSVTDRIARIVHFGTYAPVNGLVVLPDQTGNGKPELALLQQNSALDRPVVEIRDAGTTGLVRSLSFSASFLGQNLFMLDDFDGSGQPELGVQLLHRISAQPRLQMRDSESGQLIRTMMLR